jgi:hypothetical protein
MLPLLAACLAPDATFRGAAAFSARARFCAAPLDTSRAYDVVVSLPAWCPADVFIEVGGGGGDDDESGGYRGAPAAAAAAAAAAAPARAGVKLRLPRGAARADFSVRFERSGAAAAPEPRAVFDVRVEELGAGGVPRASAAALAAPVAAAAAGVAAAAAAAWAGAGGGGGGGGGGGDGGEGDGGSGGGGGNYVIAGGGARTSARLRATRK